MVARRAFLCGLTYIFAVLLGALSLGFAIFRYHLYDIDFLINRALVYSTLTLILTALYIGLIIGLQALLSGVISKDSGAAIVISTLAIAALFQPLRSHIQNIIDRRFYRSKYDTVKIIEGFSATLRNQVDLNTLSVHLEAVVLETMQPTFVSLWVRPREHGGKQGSPWRTTPPVSSGGS